MITAYAYDTQETSTIVINQIYSLLESYDWSVKTLSDKSNIPYETLKKLLNRKIENTSIHNIARIASAFHCKIDDLMTQTYLTPDSVHSQDTLICAQNYYEKIDFSCHHCENIKRRDYITVYHPFSLFSAPPLLEDSSMHIMDISSYPAELRSEIEYGIYISSHCYHPVYYEHDILLISRKGPPHFGENGIFLHNGNLYIRKFCTLSGKILLESINGIGNDIEVADFSKWDIGGYVVGIHRN